MIDDDDDRDINREIDHWNDTWSRKLLAVTCVSYSLIQHTFIACLSRAGHSSRHWR